MKYAIWNQKTARTALISTLSMIAPESRLLTFSAQHTAVQMLCPIRVDARGGHQRVRLDQDRVQGGHQGRGGLQGGQRGGRL